MHASLQKRPRESIDSQPTMEQLSIPQAVLLPGVAPTMPLTDKAIRNAKPSVKPFKLSDG